MLMLAFHNFDVRRLYTFQYLHFHACQYNAIMCSYSPHVVASTSICSRIYLHSSCSKTLYYGQTSGLHTHKQKQRSQPTGTRMHIELNIRLLLLFVPHALETIMLYSKAWLLVRGVERTILACGNNNVANKQAQPTDLCVAYSQAKVIDLA